MRKISKLLKQRLDEVVIPEDTKKISIINWMSFLAIAKKEAFNQLPMCRKNRN